MPTDFSAELFFAGGVSAGFYCSFLAEIQQWANLAGTKGFLYVPDFVLPWHGAEVAFDVSNPVHIVLGCDFNWRNIVGVSLSAKTATAPRTRRRQTCSADSPNWRSGRPDHSWGEMALKTQQVLDACLQSARSGGGIIDLPRYSESAFRFQGGGTTKGLAGLGGPADPFVGDAEIVPPTVLLRIAGDGLLAEGTACRCPLLQRPVCAIGEILPELFVEAHVPSDRSAGDAEERYGGQDRTRRSRTPTRGTERPTEQGPEDAADAVGHIADSPHVP